MAPGTWVVIWGGNLKKGYQIEFKVILRSSALTASEPRHGWAILVISWVRVHEFSRFVVFYGLEKRISDYGSCDLQRSQVCW